VISPYRWPHNPCTGYPPVAVSAPFGGRFAPPSALL